VPVVFDAIKRALDGGRDEMSRDNLVRLVVDQVVGLREYGRHGEHALPPEVAVKLVAPTERLVVLRGFVEDLQFDREVEDELLNRLVGATRDALPLRLYTVEAGDEPAITATGRRTAVAVRLTIAGGDRDGAALAVPPGQRFVRMGRGAFHGPDQQVRNELIVSNDDPFVSRRAGRLRRVGAALEVESLDQGECLVVCREDGTRIRPHNTPSRWVIVRSGDTIEFNDGADRKLSVGVEVIPER
jgi:hypothetical protein